MQPHLAIAILNYNGKKYLEAYLPAVLAASYENKSVWVIDNASTDDSIAFLSAHYPTVRQVINGGNFGFARGYNDGLKAIEAEYFLLLNSDVEVPPGFIEPVIDLMEADPQIAFAQPRVRWLRQRELFEYAGAAGGTMDALGYPFCRGRVLEHLEEDQNQYPDDAAIFWASGACMFARASVYRELGGMYEYYYMQNEEIDLCWRAQNMGYKIYVAGRSVVYHLGGGSLEWSNPKKTFFTFRNNLVLNTRNMPVMRLLWLLPIRTGLDALAALRYLAGGKPKIGLAVLKGTLAFWGWLFTHQDAQQKWPVKRGIRNCAGYFKGSIVWNYFVRKKRTYQELMRGSRQPSNL